MGGSAPAPVGSTEQLNLNDTQKNDLNYFFNQFKGSSGDLANNANQAADSTFTNFQQYNPSLNSNFQQYNPNLQTEFKAPQQLDQFSQAIIGQGVQDQSNRLNATQNQLAQQFRGNPNAARVLGAQAAVNSQLASNPLTLQAGIAQQQRDLQLQQSTNQARLAQSQQASQLQQIGNATQQQQAETSANLQGMGNAAVAQRLQFQGIPAQTQQNLLATLAGLYSLTSPKSNNPNTPAPDPNQSPAGNWIWNGSKWV